MCQEFKVKTVQKIIQYIQKPQRYIENNYFGKKKNSFRNSCLNYQFEEFQKMKVCHISTV